MKAIKAILVDDEESARDVLENLLKRFCPSVELVAKCQHVVSAVQAIQTHRPQLVFLDIEMPNYAGYEIVRFFDQIDFHMIFVTAYDQYAVRAFEISAVDYLLKPVDIDRLKEAVARVEQHINLQQAAERISHLSQTLESNELKSIILVDKGYQYVVPLEEIIAIEAQESYSNVYTSMKKYVASKNLKHFERVLEDCPSFFRVHKSWLINKAHIVNYSRSELTINLSEDIQAKLSKYKKDEFEEFLQG
jgi:two-component system LytT family response regulator